MGTSHKNSKQQVSIQISVNLNLCLLKHHATKTYGVVDYSSTLLHLATGYSKWSASRSNRFTPPGKIDPGIQ
jgi:hypothetical protein